MFVLSMLISFAIICSCQRQDSAVEGQLAQRKAELDAREKALDEREKALAEIEKVLADRDKTAASARTISPTSSRTSCGRGYFTDSISRDRGDFAISVADAAIIRAATYHGARQDRPANSRVVARDPARIAACRWNRRSYHAGLP
jgi:hypothetical protein